MEFAGRTWKVRGTERPDPAAPARPSSTTLDDEFAFLRDKVCGHVPTSRQFRSRAHPDAIRAADRLYGGYGGYLESRGLSVRADPGLADALYDNYFDLHSRQKAAPSEFDVDRHGKYAAEEYAECFGSYDRFRDIAEEVVRRMSALDPAIAKADLFRDYRRMRADLDSVPRFEQIRSMSSVGVEYYLGLFGSMADFRSAEEYDRSAALRDLESYHGSLERLLGMAPNERQMAAHAPQSGGLLRSLYPTLGGEKGEAYAAFLRDAGKHDPPPMHDPIPHKVRAEMRQRTAGRFMEELGAARQQRQGDHDAGASPAPPAALGPLGRQDILDALGDRDPAPYVEWFGSVEEFADFMISERGGEPEGSGGGEPEGSGGGEPEGSGGGEPEGSDDGADAGGYPAT